MMSNKAVKKMELPMAPIARIIKNAGTEKVSKEAIHELARLLEEYGKILAKRAVTLAEYSGREISKGKQDSRNFQIPARADI